MVDAFKDRSPVAILWLFLLSMVVHSHFLFDFPVVQVGKEDGLFSFFLNTYVAGLNSAFIIFIYHAVVIIQALRLNFLFSDHRMYSKPNYLAAMVYILLTAVFKEWSALTPALLANTFVIWLFAKTVNLYNSPDPKTLLFNIGLVIGLSILLYHPSALLILVAFFALVAVRPFDITEWFVLPMGVLAPYYFLLSYLYFFDRFHTVDRYIPKWGLNLPDTQGTPVFFVSIGVIILTLLIGLFYYQAESRRLLIQVRKNWGVLLVMLFIMLPIPFINMDAGIDSLLLWIVPASPFIAKGFLAPKTNTLPNIMFWALIVLGLVKTWGLIM